MAYTVRSSSSSGSSTGSANSGSRVRSVSLTRRPPPAKLGFSIRGGREHGTGFFITAIENHSEAFKQGLMVGDQILRVNGFPVEDATHVEVLHLIQAQNPVALKVKSVGMIPVKENPEDELSWEIVAPKTSIAQIDTFKGDLCDEPRPLSDVRMALKVPPRAKLGCGICKGPEWKPGVFVQFTKENSIARLAGLRPGDQILQCNNFSFTPDTPFSEAVSVMRCSGILELLVRKGAGLELFPGESSGYNSSASSVAGDPPSRITTLPEVVHDGNGLCGESNNEIVDQSKLRQNRAEYSNGCTVIHVGGDEPDCKKIAEICMVSQQLETKTTTVIVEVHHSEEDNVSQSQSDTSTDRLTNSSSVSSFTSSASSLSSAISQELERRSKRPPVNISERFNKSSDKLIKSGLAKEKVQQHEQLMMEFKKAHRKMFSGELTDNSKPEEREEPRLAEEQEETVNGNLEAERKERLEMEKPRSKRQVAPPPPPPLPVEMSEPKAVHQKPNVIPSTKKYPAPTPPVSPPYCPTPDYDSSSTSSESPEIHTKKTMRRDVNGKGDIVEMQSLESFKLTNPSKVKPKPPNTYFSQNGSALSDSSNSTTSTLPMKDKPIVTIREYPGGKERKNPVKFDFLQNISPPTTDDQPITSRFQNELCQTLSRATILTENETEVVNNNITNGSSTKGTIVMINPPQPRSEPQKPFYLFPNGNVIGSDNVKLSTLIQQATKGKKPVTSSTMIENGTKNSVTFNFSNKTQEVRNVNIVQPNGILKNSNSNVSHVQIQSHINMDKIAQQKSIKFG